jgi:hypothetical protein
LNVAAVAVTLQDAAHYVHGARSRGALDIDAITLHFA